MHAQKTNYVLMELKMGLLKFESMIFLESKY